MNAGRIAQLWAGRADPILPTASIERTVEFWGTLGFTTAIWEDDGGYAWVYPGDTRDGISIDYSLSDGLDPFVSAGMAYVTVPDADAVYESILATGIVPLALGDDGLPVRTTSELRAAWEAASHSPESPGRWITSGTRGSSPSSTPTTTSSVSVRPWARAGR